MQILVHVYLLLESTSMYECDDGRVISVDRSHTYSTFSSVGGVEDVKWPVSASRRPRRLVRCHKQTLLFDRYDLRLRTDCQRSYALLYCDSYELCQKEKQLRLLGHISVRYG